jgi:chorismate mutase-like protein
MKTKLTTIILLFTVFIFNIYSNTKTNNLDVDNFTKLCVLINERLELSKEVAAYKYINNLPIEDKAREKIVVENSLKKAEHEHLNSKSVESFFELQITLSKYIQETWFKIWEKKGFPKNYQPKNLNKYLRPKFIGIGNSIIKLLKTTATNDLSIQQQKEIINNSIKIKFITDKQRRQILSSISIIKLKN